MKNYRTETENKIRATYGENAPYILVEISDTLERTTPEWWERWHDPRDPMTDERKAEMCAFCAEEALTKAQRIHDRKLTPATAAVGEGATLHWWSDADAYTIIKVTKATITLQRDKATLSPDFKPEWIVGGFAGHCTNQDEQSYIYERDPNGSVIVAHWSKKRNCYQWHEQIITRGRHEFYDYNF